MTVGCAELWFGLVDGDDVELVLAKLPRGGLPFTSFPMALSPSIRVAHYSLQGTRSSAPCGRLMGSTVSLR